MAEANFKYKDRLFHFLYGREERKDLTLSLYNAVNDSDYKDPSVIQITTIENVLYLSMKNDVSFLISDELSLYEQQSTFNPNMPLRNLQYLSGLYEKHIERNQLNKYSNSQLHLPVPKFVVFYNGSDKELPDETILKLSDSFPPDSNSDVEIRTRMLNINVGHNKAIQDKCKSLMEYSWLTNQIRKNRKTMDLEEAIDLALQDMPADFLLKPLLQMHKAEVKGMLLTEYDEEKQRLLDRKDGFEEGIEIGIQKGIKEGMQEGIQNSIRMLRSLGQNNSSIIDLISSEFHITKETAQEILNRVSQN